MAPPFRYWPRAISHGSAGSAERDFVVDADEVKDRTAMWRLDLSKALQEDITLQAVADLSR